MQSHMDKIKGSESRGGRWGWLGGREVVMAGVEGAVGCKCRQLHLNNNKIIFNKIKYGKQKRKKKKKRSDSIIAANLDDIGKL